MNTIQNAIEILKNGGIGIFPTDTAFGIGCRIDNVDAVKRLFAIKQRSDKQAVPVLVDNIEMARRYVESIPADVLELMHKYWPGALTIVLKAQTGKVLPLVRGAGDSIGLRMPNHQAPLELIKGIGVPIIGTSANFHGKLTPFAFGDLDKELVQLVDFVLPGKCLRKEASTILNCTVVPWKILRQGAIQL